MYFVRGLLLIVLCLLSNVAGAEGDSKKDYPGANVVKQEIENHRLMLKSLQELQKPSDASVKANQKSFEELVNYLNAALISFEYLDSLWAGKAVGAHKMQEPEKMSANLPCACNGEALCDACGGDGYVWVADFESNAKRCKRCNGSGKNEASTDCSGCRGSGWANAHRTSPAVR